MAASILEAVKQMPSTSTLLTAYASFSTTSMLFRNVYREIVPERLESYLVDKFNSFFYSPKPSPERDTFIIDDDWDDLDRNDLLFAARAYLSTKIGPKNKRIRVGKFPHQKKVSIALAEGETVLDEFDGIEIIWKLAPDEEEGEDDNNNCDGMNYFEIHFEKRHREKVLEGYLGHILDLYDKLSHKEKSLKLYTRPNTSWRPMDLRHPTTFDTVAMDLEMKQRIMDDLDRFVARKEFYKRVGKAWKRGYLLYGPPGTGKSSLVAAMANYLNFDIYVLELCEISSDYDLRMALMGIDNKSITVVEDIDCNSEVRSRSKDKDNSSDDDDDDRRSPRFTLSTLLNCIDGLWSSRAEERIVVFTTNHKEVLDPALLRPGRMDMQIHLSFCKPQAFRTLASNYLGVKGEHPLYPEIDELLEGLEVTPAAVAEELMRDEDGDVVLKQVVEFLRAKKAEKETRKEDNKSDGGDGDGSASSDVSN
ncbi:unnamed protein product [Linum tenue]|uniref:AAA+ ATPase domain-containing protein n=1 Tax=Linum tenue TaxID=586396 RepID=A0AAV0PPB6_9ROSI|nr:unnamed protein product [Linum tenue]